MNLPQFLRRWPAKDSRIFLFAGGKDHDRLAVHHLVATHWRKKVDRLDVSRLYGPDFYDLSTALRQDPLASKQRVVVGTEVQWDDPSAPSKAAHVAGLYKIISNFPRDQVLIASTPEASPNTKNDLAQAIIRKGYWVVLTPTDHSTACDLFQGLSGWSDEDVISHVVDRVGTSPADLIAWLRIYRLSGGGNDQESVDAYLSSHAEATVFELVDAITMKDLKRALRLAKQDIPAGQLTGALDRKFSSLLQFTVEMGRGRTPKEAAMALRLPGFIVHGLYEASKRWTPHDILGVWPRLADFAFEGSRPGATELLIRDIIP